MASTLAWGRPSRELHTWMSYSPTGRPGSSAMAGAAARERPRVRLQRRCRCMARATRGSHCSGASGLLCHRWLPPGRGPEGSGFRRLLWFVGGGAQNLVKQVLQVDFWVEDGNPFLLGGPHQPLVRGQEQEVVLGLLKGPSRLQYGMKEN